MSNKSNTIKYSLHVQVGGVWRHEGWLDGERADKGRSMEDVDKDLAEMRAKVIEENGPDTFRSFAFLDEPHKGSEQDKLADVLLGESAG